ncbi:MAG: DinB family protein [Acidobacteria bacterium]|nr:DinB family protein [Acidobacteriota bacterium]
MPEVWLRGALAGVPLELQPVVHALLQVDEDIVAHGAALPDTRVWMSPGGAASAGFHLRHLAGSLDRLLTYARGEQLSRAQLAALRAEGDPGLPPESTTSLVSATRAGIAAGIAQARATPVADLDLAREVGRGRLPSTVRGLLVHAAEHSARHAGQLVTTARIVMARDAEAHPGVTGVALANWLEGGLDGDPWHGPSVFAALDGVDAVAAVSAAPDGGHAIWEVVLHMTAWTREVHRRLAGAAPEEPRDGDWPAIGDPSAAAWTAACGALRDANRALAAAVRTLGPAALAATVGGERNPALGSGVSHADMIAGLVQHHAYHGGQIARLARGLRTRG